MLPVDTLRVTKGLDTKNSMSLRVLLVEDEEDIRTMFSEQLTLEGFDVTVAVDGLDAVTKVSTSLPEVVLLDILLPELDGFEVLRRIKADNKTADITVIMLSNLNQDDQRKQSLQLGAAAFIIKSSLTPHELSEQIKKLVE